jgi:hypothetical protein
MLPPASAPRFCSESAGGSGECLQALTLDPVGEWVTAEHKFAEIEQCNFYTEGDASFNVVGAWPYTYDVTDAAQSPQVPPLGVRSAVPLGGLGTGSVELRATGRFADYQIENEGPGLFEHGKVSSCCVLARLGAVLPNPRGAWRA